MKTFLFFYKKILKILYKPMSLSQRHSRSASCVCIAFASCDLRLRLAFALGVCTVQSVWFFPKFITEPIRIGYPIIITNAYYQGSVFRPIVVWFFAVDFIGLSIKNVFLLRHYSIGQSITIT